MKCHFFMRNTLNHALFRIILITFAAAILQITEKTGFFPTHPPLAMEVFRL